MLLKYSRKIRNFVIKKLIDGKYNETKTLPSPPPYATKLSIDIISVEYDTVVFVTVDKFTDN